jgi:hypothetical protein
MCDNIEKYFNEHDKCLAHKNALCATDPAFQPFFLKDFAFLIAQSAHTHKSLGQGPAQSKNILYLTRNRKYLPVFMLVGASVSG